MGMKRKRVLSIILAAAMCLTVFAGAPMTASAAPTFSGTGAVDDPYLIEDEEDLKALASEVNSGSFVSEGKYFSLVANLDLSGYGAGYNGGKGWIPIGTYANPFKGIFEGNDYKISNLFIDDDQLDNIGLFGTVAGAVRNLHLKNVNIKAGNNVWDTGGLAGLLDSSLEDSIRGCSVTGDVKGGMYYVGGLVGTIYNGTVKNCYTTCNVQTEAQGVGGIAGTIEIHPGKKGSIEDCYSLGDIKGDSHVGGIAGMVYNVNLVRDGDGNIIDYQYGNGATVTRCYAKGKVEAIAHIVGGIAGTVAYGGTVEKCFAWNDEIKWSRHGYGGKVSGTVYQNSANPERNGHCNDNYSYQELDPPQGMNFGEAADGDPSLPGEPDPGHTYPEADIADKLEQIDLFPEDEGWNTKYPPTFPENELPEVKSITPADNATGVNLSTAISITFSKRMKTNSNPGTVAVPGAILSTAGASWSADGKTYTIPCEGLSFSTSYNVTVSGFTDWEDAAMAGPFNSTFKTRDPVSSLDKPTVSVTPQTDLPTEGSLTLTFNKPMNQSGGTVVLDGKTLSGSWTSPTTFVVNYSGLEAGKSYALTLDNFVATDNSQLDAGYQIPVTVRAGVDTEGIPSYKITFDAAGGGKVTVTVDLKTGAVYGKLPVPVRKGYTFQGWYTAQTGGTAVTENTKFTQAANQTLFAHWKPNVYTIKFNVNKGETIKTRSKKVSFGAKVGVLPKPVPRRLGYKFLGWYTTKAGGKRYTAKTTYAKAGNTVLYAHWTVLYNRALPKVGFPKVAIRTKANSTSKILGYYTKGQVFTVIKKHLRKDGSCDYLQVKYKGKIGWVRSYHVKTFKVYAKQ